MPPLHKNFLCIISAYKKPYRKIPVKIVRKCGFNSEHLQHPPSLFGNEEQRRAAIKLPTMPQRALN